MESSTHATPTVAQRLWRIVKAVFHMLQKGIARRKLMVVLELLLKCSKLAGKALRNLIPRHRHQSSAATRDLLFSDCSCRSGLDQDMLFYDPKGVQLSCSNTPSYGYYNYSHSATKRMSRRRRRDDSYDCYDAAAVAKAIEMLNNNEYSSDAESGPKIADLKSGVYSFRFSFRIFPDPAATPAFPIHDINPGNGGMIRDSVGHYGLRTRSDDGLVDAIMGSTAITVSNCHMTNHNEVFLFGASDSHAEDAVMQVTLNW
ncbi:hypothetical protein KSP40_PGU020174 [Platanthera guangdongensis]|uniref:Uncharacterized protein n=1 Tax=Platanthera guangdongensis TaxID=2320717 RepID=A0ABR2M1B7_9ASPA